MREKGCCSEGSRGSWPLYHSVPGVYKLKPSLLYPRHFSDHVVSPPLYSPIPALRPATTAQVMCVCATSTPTYLRPECATVPLKGLRVRLNL